ncbi:MAG TPA: NADP-dependent oxidoreductase [Burkholderiales bacterium]|nr:NADP-dependent oxidoreductase [Burkholderiales bacterium]
MPANKAWTLAAYLSGGLPTEAHFKLVESPAPAPGNGEVLVKNLWLSLDPYMLGRMTQQKSYTKGVEIGDVMTGETVGEVVESRHPGFARGEKVTAPAGWQLYAAVKGELLTKIDAATRFPPSYYLGCLGMPGRTAYFGLSEVGKPKPGDTLVVSAASGAVGSVVGQLGKIAGCRVVGIAGGRQKCDYVAGELGFDACIDYRAGNLYRDLKEACPKGIDIYFDNVGGETLDTVLRLVNTFARIVICGRISGHHAAEPYGIKNLGAVLVNRVRMQGIIVFDWADRYAEANKALAGYVAQGKLKTRETIVEGIERAPQGLIDLVKGRNFGKQLVKLA